MRSGLVAVTLVSFSLAACSGDDDTAADGSTFIPRDGAVATDAGSNPLDSGVVVDAGFPDSGVEADAGFPDSGVEADAGFPDSGVEADAGMTMDAGMAMDAGTAMDAGMAMDAGTAMDAGQPADAGSPDSGTPDSGPADAGPAMPTYTIDGNLSDWTNPFATLTNPGFGGTGLFGPDNIFQELRVDGDANFLYLAYRFRSSGNSAILHMDTVAGGETSPAMFNAWPRLATFATPIDHFVAQFEGQPVQFRDVASATNAPLSGTMIFQATTSNGVQRVTELAIPWSGLGLASNRARSIVFYGGIYGGDNFGAGDIIPNANSTPSVMGNTIDTNNSFNPTFASGFAVTIP